MSTQLRSVRDVTGPITADVIVVGAGFAGISAARALHQAGWDVAVLEARTRVGGRALSQSIGEGKVVELGCEFHGQMGSISAVTGRSVGVGSYKVYDQGYKLIDDGGRLRRWRGSIPKMSPLTAVDFGIAALRLERMRKEVPEESPWTAPHAVKWDNQTAWSWAQRNIHTREGRNLFRLLVEGGMAASPAEVSLLHVLNYSNGTGGFRATTTVTGGTLEHKFVGGAHALTQRLAEPVTDRIYTEAAVRRIEQSADRVIVSGEHFTATARRVIVTVPVPLAGRIEYEPKLPPERDQVTQRMTFGATIKYLAVYDEPFWRADGMSGMSISYTSPIKAVLDGSPPDGSPGVLTVFVTGPSARQLSRQSSADRRQLVQSELGRYFGARAARPRQLLEQNWLEEPYTRGCYHAYAPPGLYTELGHALARPVGRLHWAGAESVPLEFGSMSGAIFSGRRAAAEVISAEAGRDSGPAADPSFDAEPVQAGASSETEPNVEVRP